ncbi:hypothetical protein DIPPA_04892 [Diplonema papillatum]|nr:hypothetical protein DIPPA_04892 [Diplonema papillatum]
MASYVECCSVCEKESPVQLPTDGQLKWTSNGFCNACNKDTAWVLYCFGKRRKVTDRATYLPEDGGEARVKLYKAKLLSLQDELHGLQERLAKYQKGGGGPASPAKGKPASPAAKPQGKAAKANGKPAPKAKRPAPKSKRKPARAAADDEPVVRPALDKKISFGAILQHYAIDELRVFAISCGFDARCADKRIQALARDIHNYLTTGARPLPRDLGDAVEPARIPRKRQQPEDDGDQEDGNEKPKRRKKPTKDEPPVRQGKGKEGSGMTNPAVRHGKAPEADNQTDKDSDAGLPKEADEAGKKDSPSADADKKDEQKPAEKEEKADSKRTEKATAASKRKKAQKEEAKAPAPE